MPQKFDKDEDATLDYKFDWANTRNGGIVEDWLAEGDTIASYTVSVDDDGITIDDDSLTDNASSVTVWLSGGTAGESYAITNRISTVGGRVDDRTIRIYVREA